MAYEFLEKLFGANEDGTPKSLTYKELETAIDQLTDGPKIVDLNAGGYVSQADFDAQKQMADGIQKLLDTANETIKGYEEMDIDSIKESVSTWKKKYEDDTDALKQQLATLEREYAAREFLGNFQFTSDLAKEAVFNKFISAEFKRGTDGKFLGADDWMKQLQEANPGAFVQADHGKPAPAFAPKKNPEPPKVNKRLSLTEMMKYKAEHPEVEVSTLFE